MVRSANAARKFCLSSELALRLRAYWIAKDNPVLGTSLIFILVFPVFFARGNGAVFGRGGHTPTTMPMINLSAQR